MPVDIETEVVQLWAASRVVADTMKSKLPRQPDGLTIPQSGLRSGRDQQLAGPSKILNQSQGGMCICRVLGIGAGVSRECFGP